MSEQLKEMNPYLLDALPPQRESLYLLLDGALMDVPLFAYSHDDHPVVEPLYRNTRHESALSVSPCLLKPSANARLWQQQAQWQTKGVVLCSTESFPVMTQHLKSLLSVRLPSQQLAYCRYYSPTWLVRLLSSMSPPELKAWSGPVEAWYANSPEGWVCFKSDTQGVARKHDEEGWFALKQTQLEQWRTEEHQRFIDRAAEHLGCESKATAQGREQRTKVAALTDAARELGFVLEYQCLHYLELAWRFPQELLSPQLVHILADREQDADQRLQLAERQLFGLNRDV